jgi:hypothetical protein
VTALLAVRYDRRGGFHVVYGDSVDECLADAVADGCSLVTVGPRRKGSPRFFVYDGIWREISGEEFERLRGLEEPGTVPRYRNRDDQPRLWRWAS